MYSLFYSQSVNPIEVSITRRKLTALWGEPEQVQFILCTVNMSEAIALGTCRNNVGGCILVALRLRYQN